MDFLVANAVVGQSRIDSNLSRVDAIARAKEIDSYRAYPDVRMPVMLPVSNLGGRVQWPAKFQL